MQTLHLESASYKLKKWQWRHTFPTGRHRQFFWCCFVFLVKVSYWSNFHVNIILVLELWQFSFIRDWPEIQKLEIPLSEFCPISEDWGKLGIPNLARMFLIKCYSMLQNARVTAFTVSKLLRKNQQWVKLPPPPPNQIRVNTTLFDRYYLQDCEAITFRKIINHLKYK